jgi:hypothetical protein
MAASERGGQLDSEQVVLLGMTLTILAGVAVLWIAVWNRRQIREMQHRERLAMIDRGLIPPPELDPAGFETRSGLGPPPSDASNRSRSAGVLLIGFGLGLMMLLGFTVGEPEVGIGIGGAFALLGAAFIVNGMLSAPKNVPPWQAASSSRARGPNRPPEPPAGSLP